MAENGWILSHGSFGFSYQNDGMSSVQRILNTFLIGQPAVEITTCAT